MTPKPFWTSLLDGMIGEGASGDLHLPGSPARMFRSEPDNTGESNPEQPPAPTDEVKSVLSQPNP